MSGKHSSVGFTVPKPSSRASLPCAFGQVSYKLDMNPRIQIPPTGTQPDIDSTLFLLICAKAALSLRNLLIQQPMNSTPHDPTSHRQSIRATSPLSRLTPKNQ
jgi:hypothetical protein